ncbi:MAG: RecX family transcriptional regulator [Alphaproteobacteria bacterium]|nr:RecX family transcriptional regulator [Alphaproteobacteria bacterium]
MRQETRGQAIAKAVDRALIERWALAYLGRFASSAANLRLVLLRRARKRLGEERDALAAAAAEIDRLVARYRETRLIDDAAYAAGRARSRLRRGQSLRTIRAGLAAKGVAAADAAAALAGLAGEGDPDLAAAVAFARRRRLGPFRRDGDAERDRERAAFARAGFSRAAAAAVLGCADEDEAEALVRGER